MLTFCRQMELYGIEGVSYLSCAASEEKYCHQADLATKGVPWFRSCSVLSPVFGQGILTYITLPFKQIS